jgi:hypothetical protein
LRVVDKCSARNRAVFPPLASQHHDKGGGGGYLAK